MEIIVKPVMTDLIYQIFYKHPMLHLSKEDIRLSIIGEFIKAFKIRLNNIRFNMENASNNYIHFSTFDDLTFFDISFGLEETTVTVQKPKNEKQVFTFFSSLSEIIKDIPLSRQKLLIHQHLSTISDANTYLESLNPSCPHNFKKNINGRGVFYNLKYSKHNLFIYITLVSSLFVPGGIYFSIENDFSPNKYDFQNAFSIAKERRNFIWKEFKMKILEEVQNESEISE